MSTIRPFLSSFALAWPGEQAVITSLASGRVAGTVTKVELLGSSGTLAFRQDAEGLKVQMPAERPNGYAYAFKITGFKLR